jgi:hypothetical protein
MTSKPESNLQSTIKKHLKKEFPKSWWMKVHGGPYQIAGVPDLLGCVEGNFIALEVKMPDGDPPTKIQKQQMKRIKRAEGYACVVTSEEEAVRAVRSALALSKESS